MYGVPRSQAHPRAWEETEAILRPLTEELVMGRHGPRVIGGDFNRPAGSSRELAIWRDHGWQEIQDLALARWGKAVEMTCKHATRHDFLWLSPEAAALCSGSEVHHSFVDHVVLEAKLHVPSSACRIFTWPRPSTIPWDDTQVDLWHQTATPFRVDPRVLDSTQWFQDFTGRLRFPHLWRVQAKGCRFNARAVPLALSLAPGRCVPGFCGPAGRGRLSSPMTCWDVKSSVGFSDCAGYRASSMPSVSVSRRTRRGNTAPNSGAQS